MPVEPRFDDADQRLVHQRGQKVKHRARLVLGPDGGIVVASSEGPQVRRIGPDGIITRLAGTGTVARH